MLERDDVVATLAAAGCIAPDVEADELMAASAEGAGPLGDLVARRVDGEPLPWITRRTTFCGVRIEIVPGVFVPRPHTEPLARRAVQLLPADGLAADLCTGSGAIAVVLRNERPGSTVVATDVDPVAVACARGNGVDARVADLAEPPPPALVGRAHVVSAVVPYVPTEELHLLPRDVRRHEPRRALEGGPGGIGHLTRAAEAAVRWLRPGGAVLLELGGDQADALRTTLSDLGFGDLATHRDEDGDVRAIEGRSGG